jgi:hypothetical protein
MPVKGLTAEEIAARTFEQVQSSVKSTSSAAKLPGESQGEANARLTAAYRELQARPVLSQEAIDAGAKVQYTRQAAGGIGEYVFTTPLGYKGPTITKDFGPGIVRSDLVRTDVTTAGVAPGTIVPKGVTTTTASGSFGTAKTPEQVTAYNNAKDLAQSFVDTYGGSINDYFNPTTGIVTQPSAAVINKKFTAPTGKKEVSRVDNGDGTFTVTYDDKTTAVIGTKKVVTGVTSNNPAKTLISTQIDNATGNTIGYFSDGSQEILNQGTGPVQSQEFKDAYALLEATFRDYGLESLVPTIKSYMERDLGPEQAALELRTSPEYIARFKGNQLRLAAGKNALREDIYLATERAYDETLTSYGQANYFGIDRQAKQAKMAQIIGNDISADEFKSRVDLAVARVSNADPTIKKLLKDFYPSLNDADLVGYFLNPAEGLPKLTEKVTSAEIGSAFLGQGLDYTQQRSTELAQYGIDRAGALKGALEIKEVLPDTQKLGNIYGESGIKYTQQTAEEEFLKDNQDAATKRKRLASMERGSFGGSAGNAPGAYSTGYLKKSSAAGLI